MTEKGNKGRGRPKGSKDRLSAKNGDQVRKRLEVVLNGLIEQAEMAAARVEVAEAAAGNDPERLGAVVLAANSALKIQCRVFDTVAPYVLQKQPTAVDITSGGAPLMLRLDI